MKLGKCEKHHKSALSFRYLVSQMWPNASEGRITELIEKSLFEKPDKVAITTIPRDTVVWRKKVTASKELYNVLYFTGMKFAIPRSAELFFPLEEKDVFRYPDKLDGDLLKIRGYLEQEGFVIISDDDPGASFKGSEYVPSNSAKVIIPCDCLECGAHRFKISAKLHYKMWQILFALGREIGVAYVGFNQSEQAVVALEGHNGNGKKRSSFGNYGYIPVILNGAITGAEGILKPVRYLVPKSTSQEFSMASATAIWNGYKTLLLRTVLLGFAIKPPKQDAEEVRTFFPTIVESGNTARGSKERKTGCIVHFKTREDREL